MESNFIKTHEFGIESHYADHSLNNSLRVFVSRVM